MKEITITTSFTAYNAANELPNDIQNLMEQAINVRKKAYAPYSKFRVGVAILLDNGKIVSRGRTPTASRRSRAQKSVPSRNTAS